MKKTAIALAMATVLGVAGTAMAANPFTDVPANHWSYASVAKLAQAGIVEGYGDGTFQGNNTMTRYEMAQIVAKAMARSDKADAAQKAMIEKLAAEYSTELNNLGVRVSALEKKTGTVKVTGDARIRYRENYDLAGFKTAGVDNQADKSRWDYRIRLGLAANVNDNVAFTGRLAAANTSYQQVGTTTDASNNGTVSWDLAYFTFKHAFGGTFEAGRFAQFVGATGLVTDVSNPGVDGVRYTYTNKDFRIAASHVDVSTNKTSTVNFTAGSPDTYDNGSLPVTYVDAAWNASKKLTLNGVYFKSNDEKTFAYKGWDAGASYKFDNIWKLSGDYAKNTASVYDNVTNSGYLVRVNYKGADYAKEGSWGAWVDYRKAPANIADQKITTLLAQNNTYGAKGYEIGVNYTLTPNVLMQFMFDSLKSVDGTRDYSNFYRFETNFKF